MSDYIPSERTKYNVTRRMISDIQTLITEETIYLEGLEESNPWYKRAQQTIARHQEDLERLTLRLEHYEGTSFHEDRQIAELKEKGRGEGHGWGGYSFHEPRRS